MNKYDLIIIGAGVSGTFAAINANNKIKTLLIDSNSDILEKFMITGKGKSNITNTLPIKEFLNNLIDSNKFLYPSLNKYNSNNLINFLDDIKIKYHEKSKNRIHLLDDNSIYRNKIKSILNSNKNLKIKLNTKVIDVIESENSYKVKILDNNIYHAENIIFATGGLSYKNFGCDGSGYKILSDLGHEIKKQYPIGVGFITKKSFKELQGISIKNVEVAVIKDNKKIYSEIGSLIFTHFGIGGPVIRRVSGYVGKLLSEDKMPKIMIKWLNHDDVVNELNSKNELNQCFKSLNKKVRNFLLNDFDFESDLGNMKLKDKEKIINIMTNYNLEIKQTQSIDIAINTGGGVSLKDVNPNTFESYKKKNVYIVGEMLDLNPRTNGFNITVCYSSALTAINSINKKYDA